MKYLIFASMIFIFSHCNPASNIIYEDVYYVFTANDPLQTCNSPNHIVSLGWFGNSYQMINKSTYSTEVIPLQSGQETGVGVSTQNSQCNNITIDLYYANGTLIESKTFELGYQSDCQTYCADSWFINTTFGIP